MSNEDIKGKLVASNGSVIPRLEVEQACPTCKTKLIYSESHDALFCAACNEWREHPCCGDPSCEYCGGRPLKPLLQPSIKCRLKPTL